MEGLNKYLSNRLKEVFTEGKWVVGTNLKEEITNLTFKEAVTKIKDLNTIADLVFHLHYYVEGVLKVLEGGSLDISDKYSFKNPPIYEEKEWQDLVISFCKDSEKIISLVEKMTNDDLLKDFADKKYGSTYRNIDLMIEHSYYHFGQIILIKKLLKNS